MSQKIFFCFLLMLFFIFSGCATRKYATVKKDYEKVSNKISIFEYEKQFNPADYDCEFDLGIARIDSNVGAARTETIIPVIPKDTLVVKEEIIQGFRIQVLSTSGVDEANIMKEILKEKFPNDPIYIIYDTPVYKLRVGDFVSRYEASQRLPEFVEKGYKDAWIVPDRIVRKTYERVSLPENKER